MALRVSGRRLRKAYTDEFDVSPAEFFRTWAVDAARRRLAGVELGECTVAAVATDLGLSPLGRFAGYYRHTFGEYPSETLRTISTR
jgi:AraC-like DNA-binding protein